MSIDLSLSAGILVGGPFSFLPWELSLTILSIEVYFGFVDDKLFFQFYLVSFFDILGQRESLRRITALPTDEKEKEQFLDLIKKSLGKVLAVRRSFQNFFDKALNTPPNVNLVPPEFREEFLASQKVKLHFYGLSDAIIIAVPLVGENENCNAINSVYSALVATGGMGLLALSSQIAIRAGLDVGVGVLIDENDVYGPAFERAFQLESELAEYPRLLVGNELINYLKSVENKQYKTRFGLIAKNMAKKCSEMIVQDTDGRPILDFLGIAIRDLLREGCSESEAKETAKDARNFVTSQYQKFITEGDHKLAARYFRLLHYFQSRESIWQ